MTSARENQWSSDAEAALMGYTIPVESKEHLRFMTQYVLNVLKDKYSYNVEDKTEEVIDNSYNKYNSSRNKSIQYFTVNTSPFGTLLTFVRDHGRIVLKDGSFNPNGNFSWVENLDSPECSECGCVFFKRTCFGKIHRIS